jgi:hypothetical protein
MSFGPRDPNGRAKAALKDDAKISYRTATGRRPLGVPEEDSTLPALYTGPYVNVDRAEAYQHPVKTTKFSQSYRFHKLGKEHLSRVHIEKLNKGLFSPGPIYVLPSSFQTTGATRRKLGMANQYSRDGAATYVRHAHINLDAVTPRFHLRVADGVPLFPANEWSTPLLPRSLDPVQRGWRRREERRTAAAAAATAAAAKARRRPGRRSATPTLMGTSPPGAVKTAHAPGMREGLVRRCAAFPYANGVEAPQRAFNSATAADESELMARTALAATEQVQMQRVAV